MGVLRNQKYTGDSTIMTGSGTYLKSGNLSAIIKRSVFEVVQQQLEMRSNISVSEYGTASRKSRKYSGKTVLRKTVDLGQLMDDLGFNDS